MLILDEINLLINKSEEINVESDTSDSSSILMTINIPKINVNNNIYSFGSYENNIDKNVIIMNESNMPDVKNGNLIIGGHSGVGDIAYFKDFDKLDKGDKVIIRYKNKKYEYIIDKFYKDYKDGSISIVRDLNRNTITLYTCMPNNKKYYLVVIGYLKDF